MGKRQGIMLATKYTERRAKKWLKECDYIIGQPKLNGERLKWTGEELLTSEGNVCNAVPNILGYLYSAHRGGVLDGEGYKHGWSKQKIRSVFGRRVNLHPEHGDAEYWIFDLPIDGRQLHRLNMINMRVSSRCKYLKIVPYYTLRSIAEIKEMANTLVLNGYEGLILRHPSCVWVEKRSTMMMKLKPGYREDCLILQIKEGAGKYAGTMGAMVVLNAAGEVFNVGSFRITDPVRHQVWKDRALYTTGQAYATIRFTELTDRGVPPSGVFEKIV